jgi:hypothetical protein
MTYDPFLIAPWDSEGAGLVEYYKPWMIGNDAFPILEDAYCWRGSVRKREGFVLLAVLPTTPVQGLRTYYVPATGDEQLIGFSTTKSYLFNNTTGVFDNISFFQTSGAAISWTGGNDDYFWSANFANSLWATNNVDNLRFWNGSTTQGWNNQKPIVNGSTRLDKCLMVFPYKGRLVILSTQEGGSAFRQRARWSQIGTPYVLATGGDPAVVPPTPFTTDDNAWRDDIPGKGGFIDADTNERIISAGIVRDTLIVFFQRSTWRLRYTGNEILPFIWERLNTQYGSEATFSTIPFDEHLLTFSRYGFVAADTNSVKRIDEKIPDQSFNVEAGTTLASLQRIHGIRDFYRQTAYWAYPLENTSVYPDRILNYNYLDRTWARFKQSFRVFGYYRTFNDLTWASSTTAWENSDFPWSGPWNQADFPQVVAADANTSSGNVYIVYDIPFEDRDNGTNYNFSIYTKRFNPYIKEGRRCKLGYVDIYCTGTENGQVTVNHFIDDEDGFPILTRTVDTSTTNEGRYVRVYLGAIARFHQLQITLSAAQLADAEQGTAQFEMQGLLLWTRPEGRLKTG